MGEVILGTFYEAELQHARETGLRFDKVLKYKKDKRFVQCKGYSNDKFNTWLKKKEVDSLKS